MNKAFSSLLVLGVAGLLAAGARAGKRNLIPRMRQDGRSTGPGGTRHLHPGANMRRTARWRCCTWRWTSRRISNSGPSRLGDAPIQALVKPVREIKLDAVDLDIRSVASTEKIQACQATGENLILTFAAPLPRARRQASPSPITAEPKRGLYFRTPEKGYKAGDTHLFTQGEESSAAWYPCLDSPN